MMSLSFFFSAAVTAVRVRSLLEPGPHPWWICARREASDQTPRLPGNSGSLTRGRGVLQITHTHRTSRCKRDLLHPAVKRMLTQKHSLAALNGHCIFQQAGGACSPWHAAAALGALERCPSLAMDLLCYAQIAMHYILAMLCTPSAWHADRYVSTTREPPCAARPRWPCPALPSGPWPCARCGRPR